MDATNQLKQAFALSCFQLIKWWKCISPTPRNLFHNQIPCQPLPFHSLEKLQVGKVGRKGGMNRNEEHWRCCYFSPSLEVIIWQKLMSKVKQRRKKGFFWVWVCPHLLISQTHHLRDFTLKFQKGENRNNTKPIQTLFMKPSWKLSFLQTVISSCRKELFPHTEHLPLNLHPAYADKLLEGFSPAKPCVWRIEMQINSWQQHLPGNVWKAEFQTMLTRSDVAFAQLQLSSEPRRFGVYNC